MYNQRSGWGIVLALFGLGILGITLFYSNYLANRLKASEEKNQELFIESLRFFAKQMKAGDFDQDIGIQNQILTNFSLPSIIKRTDGSYEADNWGEKRNADEEFLEKKIQQFIKDGKEPVDYPAGDGKIYVFNSTLVNLIRYYPLVQVLLVGLFIGLGYYVFNASRSAEQNRVWAGMAKETAHQLGTPISAILAWIEHLRLANEDEPDQLEILDELGKDVDRLDLIADRFSKIGSSPELERTNLYEQLDDIKSYMQRRAPRRVNFKFPEETVPLYVNVNQHLFSWVLENLIRNSLDAMGGKGLISAEVSLANKQVNIDLSDTGKGIPSNKHKSVFAPGYSTKQRGWGLGLSLAKRIIENYHKGKIFVKSSKVDEGTTFTISLPLA
jgi:hypothetical protein